MNAYENASATHRAMVDELLADTAKNGGLAPVDLERFWKDQELSRANPFGQDIPQMPLGAICNWECAFEELGEPQDWQRWVRHGDEAWALDLSQRYNDLAETIVGRRLLNETPGDPTRAWPAIKGLHDIFEAENVWEGGPSGSWWLKQSAHSPEELAALLDRVEARLENLREFMLPENWESEKARLTAMGCSVPGYRHQRGPCTFACSIYGAQDMLLLYYDDPKLMARFSDVIGHAILARAKVLDEEAGFTAETKPHSWYWFDDNCCLFSPGIYEHFAMPIHRRVMGYYAPNPADRRYQHSDSDMAHLLPQLGELNLSGTNFGPTLSVTEIREHCPNAIIEGQLAPFTFSRNEEANMVAEFLRDMEQAREKRGLVFTTAGSINNGSRLSSMRLLMAAIQRYGQYDIER